ncbi:MAG: hypothetical protein ABR564_08925 [Candidatus Dormibacteria bacterium]
MSHGATRTDIVDTLLRQRAERRLRDRDRRAIRLIDATLNDLEELLLAGRKRVPDSFFWPLARVTAAVPAEFRQELPTGIGITRLMDRLYTIQEHLLRRKVRRTRLLEEHRRLVEAGAGTTSTAARVRWQLAHL